MRYSTLRTQHTREYQDYDTQTHADNSILLYCVAPINAESTEGPLGISGCSRGFNNENKTIRKRVPAEKGSR